MAINPQSIASIGQSVDLGGAVEKAYTLSDAIDRSQMNKMTLAAAREDAADNAKLKELTKGVDLADPESRNALVGRISKEVGGRQAMAFERDLNANTEGRLKAEESYLQNLEHRSKLFESATEPFVIGYQEAKAKGGASLQEYEATVLPAFQKTAKDLMEQKLPNGKPLLDPAHMQAIQTALSGGPGSTMALLQSVYTNSQDAQTKIAARRQETLGEKNVQSEIATREANAKREAERDAETKRHHKEIEGGGAGGGKKPPAGYMWDPENEGELKFIPGGPKDPTKSSISGRESVMFSRVASSANEAVAAIQNIVELPLGASSGVLGVGGSAGHGILSSTKASLTNEMASQDVQDYNTMLAGVRRNLATIETAGLAPSGALTEGFASLELRAGDTEITKMRKLAEMRQVVEKGLEINLDNPRLPQEQKSLVQKIINDVKKAVPFTQHDVTSFQKSGKENKGMTLTEYMAKTVAPPAVSETTPVPSPATGGTGAAGGTKLWEMKGGKLVRVQ